MTNNDQHKSSPTSAISVIGVWQYGRVQMSRTLFLILSLVFIYVLIPIQKQIHNVKPSELCIKCIRSGLIFKATKPLSLFCHNSN
jgi:hypothetical protein